ncbi:Transcriptional regulator, AraC family protein [Minicystis rosea]|nr:Transcriptional regulator, AraC family protein [Minicystis rosea]
MSANPTSTLRAQSARVTLWDVRCNLGPGDAPFPERHGSWTIAVVRRGAFSYRAHDERRPRELREGWLLLGRMDAEFECAHPTCTGDDCTSLTIDTALLEDARREVRLAAPGLLPTSVLPPVPRVAGVVATARSALTSGAAIDPDALAMEAITAVLGAYGAERAASRAPSARDAERVRAALDLIDAHCADPWPLAELADRVGASPFHFARAFRAIVGTSPHRYLVDARVRRAAALLLDTRRRATDVALDVGFGDLSNFVHTFHDRMGMTPRDFRARGRRPPRA